MVVSLFTMPAYMTFFSDQVILGVWFTLISILNWILSFDLGIGNGLRNNLVKALSEKDDEKIRKYISSAYVILGFISVIIAIVGYLCIGLLNWNNLLKISSNLLPNIILIRVVRLLFVGIISQFFLRIIVSILYAMQKTVLPSILSLISTITLLIFMLVYKSNDIQKSIVTLALINIMVVNIPLFITTIVLFRTKLKKSTPSFKFYVKEYAYKIIKLGGNFFFIQIMFLIITSTNLVLITWIYGAEHVVQYQIYFKLFNLFATIFALIANPVWSAVTKAYVEKKYVWIKKIYNYLNLISLLGLCACFLLVIVLQFVLNKWLGVNTITVNYNYAILFAINSGIMIYTFAVTSIANGIGNLKPQLICNTIVAVLKVPLAYMLSYFIDSWISIVIVNITLMLPCIMVQSIIIKKVLEKKILEKNKNIRKKILEKNKIITKKGEMIKNV